MLRPLLSLIIASTAFAQSPPGSAPAAPPRSGPPDGRLPKLPAAITSFGAAATGDALYIYGGHIGRAHAHSRKNLADGFWRISLTRPEKWEALPKRDPVQGLALVAWRDSVIRIGGVEARNDPGEPTDMHSTAAVERFDPEAAQWVPLTPLPEPRSSFDAVVHDGRLYVIGGWRLSGRESSGAWAEKNYSADLSRDPLVWEEMPVADFRQRALAVAATAGRIYAIGGITPEGETTQAVHIFDPVEKLWSKGPDLPVTGSTKAFGASAWGLATTLWASGADGRVFALDEGAPAWRDADFTLQSPRFFHRILPHPRGSLLFIGGAGKGGHLDDIETVDLTLLEAKAAAALPPIERTPENASASPAPTLRGQQNWSAFRGDGSSHSEARELPLEWSDESGVAWALDLDGYGQSSPVVWGNRVFVTAVAGEKKERLLIVCASLSTGEKLWTCEIPSSVGQAVSDYVSKAAPTPCVDGTRAYCFFETGDLVALDHDGAIVWQRNLAKDIGEFRGNHGVGSSLAQTADSIFVLIDHDGPGALLSIDKATGKDRWRVERTPRVSWSSPLAVASTSRAEIFVSSAGIVEAFDAASGERRWFAEGFKMNNVPSPVLADGMLVAGSSDRNMTVAIRIGGAGDVAASHLAWRAEQASSSFASPVITGVTVFSVNRAGVLFANALDTGALRWSVRLPDSCWATPIAVGGRLYCFSKNGATTLLDISGAEPRKIAESKLTITGRLYGAAAVDRNLILRTGSQLLCVRE
jgi:outer membrane protein assembly factor BamB